MVLAADILHGSQNTENTGICLYWHPQQTVFILEIQTAAHSPEKRSQGLRTGVSAPHGRIHLEKTVPWA